jgi:hypothetical protein
VYPILIPLLTQTPEPKTRKQLRGFIGLVNYYRNMWIQRSHVLAPLSELCSKNVTWKWTEAHCKAFNEAKKIVAREEFVLVQHLLEIIARGMGSWVLRFNQRLRNGVFHFQSELLILVQMHSKTVCLGPTAPSKN